MKNFELLAPCGDYEKLITAIHFGADAVYFAGKSFGLRAFSSNFDNDEIVKAINYAHKNNVKVYITVNILAHNNDFNGMIEYLKFLDANNCDGVIVSDFGIATLVKKYTNLELHVSTQANVTNKYSAKAWVDLGAKRLVLARELSLKEIKEIKEYVGNDIDIECFVHGAMCISYSGRCLLSNYLTKRDSNKGACAQICRWNFLMMGVKEDPTKEINDKTNKLSFYPIEEDNKGTYILNSKDLCLINYLKELKKAGISSLKVEGRMKSNYYVATVINCYRRAIDNMLNNKEPDFNYIEELKKTSNRDFTTGFYFNETDRENIETSRQSETHKYIAQVVEDTNEDGYVLVEHRNKFKKGDELEILSITDSFNKKFFVEEIKDLKNNDLDEVKAIKQRVYLKCPYHLKKYDILRIKEK